MKLVFATSNPHKLTEIREMMPQSYNLLSLSDIGLTEEIPETGTTFEANAEQKSRYVFEKYHLNCFADDSGLEVEALQNRPGVFSARYAGEQRNMNDNIHKLLDELSKKNNRQARFRTVICLIINGQSFFFDGVIKGNIIHEKRGGNGFGYDPVFIPDGYLKTFAEMTNAEKNNISHRAIAVKKLAQFLVLH